MVILMTIDGGWNIKGTIYPRVFLPKIGTKGTNQRNRLLTGYRVRRIVINGAAEPITFEQRAQR